MGPEPTVRGPHVASAREHIVDEAFFLATLSSATEAREGGTASVNSCIAEFFFDAQKLVVLGNALGTSRCASLDLTGVGGNCEVSNGDVFGLAGTVRGHRTVAVTVCFLNRIEGFGERTDLVDLNQQSVGGAKLDALAQTLRVGNMEVPHRQDRQRAGRDRRSCR